MRRLNKARTVVAVKRAVNEDEDKKTKIINTVSINHNIELTAINTPEANKYAKSFPDSNEWIKG